MISPSGVRRLRASFTVALLLLTAGGLLVRVVAIAEPLGIDQSLWASAVRGMSRGQVLYRDVWEQRPPGIYWMYLAGFHLFGWTPAAVAWLDIVSATATTLLLYVIVKRLGGPLMGLLTAALYATCTLPAWLYGHGGFLERSVSETFVIPCIAAAALCAVGVRARASLPAALGVGFFCGAAVVFKPNAGLYFPALLAWAALYATYPVRRALVWRTAAAAVAAAAIVPAVALGWLWHLDVVDNARVAVLDFNRYYVGQGFTLSGYALDFSKAIWLRMKTDPLWMAGGAAFLVTCWEVVSHRRLPPVAGLAVFWGGAAAIVIIVNGARLFNSYFINALPPLAIFAAWLLLPGAGATRGRRSIAVAAAALMLVLLIQRDYAGRVLGWARADLDVLRGRVPPASFLERFGGYANGRGYSARANAELAAYVRGHTDRDDRIYLFGINGAGVYFAADRLTAHRFLRVNFFVESDFPDRQFTLPAVIADLEAAQPRYLVFERLHGTSRMAQAADALPDHPDVVRLLRRYTHETTIEDFRVYRRMDRQSKNVTHGVPSREVAQTLQARREGAEAGLAGTRGSR